MYSNSLLFLLGFVLIACAWVLSLIYKQKLKEVYAVIWVTTLVAIFLGLIFNAQINRLFGLGASDRFFVVGAFAIFFVVLVHFSALNSRLQKVLKNTTQKVTLLEEKINRIEMEKENDNDNDKIHLIGKEKGEVMYRE